MKHRANKAYRQVFAVVEMVRKIGQVFKFSGKRLKNVRCAAVQGGFNLVKFNS